MKKLILIIAIFIISPLSSYAHMTDKELIAKCSGANENKCLFKLAKGGDGNAWYMLGMKSYMQNLQKPAIQFFGQSAKLNFPSGEYMLGTLFFNGDIKQVKNSKVHGIAWLLIAIRNHNQYAKMFLKFNKSKISQSELKQGTTLAISLIKDFQKHGYTFK